jgi:hypothetical protein
VETIVTSQAAIWADFLLKTIGAGAVLTILYHVVQIARGWGRIEVTVQHGFDNNSRQHGEIIGRIDGHAEKLDSLHHEVGVLQGKTEDCP